MLDVTLHFVLWMMGITWHVQSRRKFVNPRGLPIDTWHLRTCSFSAIWEGISWHALCFLEGDDPKVKKIWAWLKISGVPTKITSELNVIFLTEDLEASHFCRGKRPQSKIFILDSKKNPFIKQYHNKKDDISKSPFFRKTIAWKNYDFQGNK